MKKVSIGILVVLIGVSIFLLGFGYKHGEEPNTYYQVYLEDEILGTIKSKKKLEDYINKQGEYIKKKYGVDTVYAPTGLKIEKVTTYHDQLTDVKEVYNLIEEKQDFSIKGYKMTIKTKEEPIVVYVTSEEIFRKSADSVMRTFIGTDRYEAYQNHTQVPISTTGTIIENAYLGNDITIKETNISVSETIYKDAAELTKYLLFGTTKDQKSYTVKMGDTISMVAFNNEISVEEFLISNPQFTNSNNLLFPGQEVVIGIIDPKVSVVVEENIVRDDTIQFKSTERVDNSMLIGDSEVIQKGEDGLIRVRQKVQTINGVINFVEPLGSEELKPSVDQIVVKGGKYVPSVGSLTNWTWPTRSGYTISSDYAYRINPFTHKRELHAALDISGTGYGSPVYASNNGTIITATSHYSYGNYIIINHNNGYYTLYAHMSKLEKKTVGTVVSAGTVIGAVGMSGDATGPHLHFEVWYGGKPWGGGTRINPWNVLRR